MALRLLRDYESSDGSGDEATNRASRSVVPLKYTYERRSDYEDEESSRTDEMVRRNNFINANLHGPEAVSAVRSVASLLTDLSNSTSRRRIIKAENSDGDDEDDDDEDDDDDDDDDDEEEDSDDDSDSVSYTNSECDLGNLTDSDNDPGLNSSTKPFDKNTRPFLKVKGELGLEDLPPIKNLKISVDHEECELFGSIYNIVDKLVIVQSLPNKPSLDLETILFLDNGAKVLGQVFDVFGQITEPFYSVRFNSANHIKQKNIVAGLSVYYAPKTDHTNFIVLSDLMKMKGSDASWQHDIEIPPEFADYSDDEKERAAKREQKNKTQSETENANKINKRHKSTDFEERMNKRNTSKSMEWHKNKSNQTFGQRQQQHQHRMYNPFSSPINSGQSNQNREIRWSSNPNVGFGTPYQPITASPISGNWDWNVQNAAVNTAPPPCVYNSPPPAIRHPYGVPYCNIPSYIKPSRFTVTPFDLMSSPLSGALPSPRVTRYPNPKPFSQNEQFPMARFSNSKLFSQNEQFQMATFSSPQNFAAAAALQQGSFLNPIASTSTFANIAHGVTAPPPPPPPPTVSAPPANQPLSNPSTSTWSTMYTFPAPPGT